MNKKILFIINFFVSGLVLYVLFYKIGFNDVIDTIKNVKIYPLVIAIIISIIFRILFSPFIWGKILWYNNLNVYYFDLVKINAMSLPLKFILPFKISEVVRAAGLKIFSKEDFSVALSSTIFLRIIVFISTLQLFFISAIFTNRFILSLVVMFIVLIFISFLEIIVKFLDNNLNFRWMKNLVYCFTNIKTKNFIKLNFLSIICQLGEILSAKLIFISLGFEFSLAELIYYVTLIMLVSSLPVSLQGLGIRESVAVISLSKISSGLALSFGLLQSMIYHIIPALVGNIIWLADYIFRCLCGSIISNIFAWRKEDEEINF